MVVHYYPLALILIVYLPSMQHQFVDYKLHNGNEIGIKVEPVHNALFSNTFLLFLSFLSKLFIILSFN